MPEKLKPDQIIQNLAEQRKTWTDTQILTELESLMVLPDEEDQIWDTEQPWNLTYLFTALANTAAIRKLHAALPLLLERACYGDPGETMHGLHHQLEAIINPNWEILTKVWIEAAAYPQPGARLWAIVELGRLRDKQAVQTLINALQDQKELVREEACHSLGMICQTNSEWREIAIEALQKYIENKVSEQEKKTGLEEIEFIRNL